jgi:hypothetical protein
VRVGGEDRKRRVEALVATFETTPKQTKEEASKAVLLAGRAAPAEPYLEPQPLGLDQLRVKGKPRPVDQVSLDKLKAELATDLPTGYEEMMRTVGPGLLRNTVRVYGPLSILRDTKSWRERIAQYWFWGDGPLLSKQASQSSVRIAQRGAEADPY